MELNEAIRQAQGRIDAHRMVLADTPDGIGQRSLEDWIETQETLLAELTRLQDVEWQFEMIKRHERVRWENADKVLGVKTGDDDAS